MQHLYQMVRICLLSRSLKEEDEEVGKGNKDVLTPTGANTDANLGRDEDGYPEAYH